ncbi:DNA sulfur modification protein DndB [Streptomyces werraensis]|uniref:DNA sulfur modification protein DndB n=1 Tax=Streptomyces werraensis TaxID=68284 RepID=UPI0037D4C542
MSEAPAAKYATRIEVEKGQPIRVMPVREHLSLATVTWGHLSRIVPDPRRAEDPKALPYLSAAEREQAEIRNEIQRMIHGTKKKENAKDYAQYIANGIAGIRGESWATPPFALWVPQELEHVEAEGPFGVDHIAYLPFDASGVLMDAETQHLAHILLSENPALYGITREQVTSRLVCVEIYHGIPLSAARQIFHDRNLLGVIPNKNVALNSDSNDAATSITFALMDRVLLPHPLTGQEVSLKALVATNKRQLKVADPEWMTLSTLRSFTVTMIFGRSGFEKTSGAVTQQDLPKGYNKQAVEDAIVQVASTLFRGFAGHFASRTSTVIAAPAVLAALGAVGHRCMPWSEAPHRSTEELSALLSDVIWTRDPEVWNGIAGKTTASGALSVAGGVKDNGSKTATALEDAKSPTFARIRGQQSPAQQVDPPTDSAVS